MNYIRNPGGTSIAFCIDDPESIQLEKTVQDGKVKTKNLALDLKLC